MKIATIAASLLALLSVAPPTSAQSRTPGVTDTEITLGLTGPMSGPAAIYGNLMVAIEAWSRSVNDQGGINGRKLNAVRLMRAKKAADNSYEQVTPYQVFKPLF